MIKEISTGEISTPLQAYCLLNIKVQFLFNIRTKSYFQYWYTMHLQSLVVGANDAWNDYKKSADDVCTILLLFMFFTTFCGPVILIEMGNYPKNQFSIDFRGPVFSVFVTKIRIFLLPNDLARNQQKKKRISAFLLFFV